MKHLLQKFQPVLLSLIFLGGITGGLVWLSFGVATLGEDLKEKIQTIANENAFDTQYNNLLGMVEETESLRYTLEQFVLRDDSDTIALLSKFDDIATNQRVELSTNDLGVIEKTGDYNDLSIAYTLAGSDRSVTNMIKIFETLPYHGHITSLSIHRDVDEETGATDLQASISVLLSIKKYDQ